MPKAQRGRQEPTFIEQARRRQIIEAAIEVLAASGYEYASLERIALRAGISRGLISYHFAGRDELMAAVVARAYEDGAAYMGPRIKAAKTPTEMLLAYTRAADELRQAYEIARLNTSNLPPYDKLVPPPDHA